VKAIIHICQEGSGIYTRNRVSMYGCGNNEQQARVRAQDHVSGGVNWSEEELRKSFKAAAVKAADAAAKAADAAAKAAAHNALVLAAYEAASAAYIRAAADYNHISEHGYLAVLRKI